ncbi:MAG: hypothetical protein CMD31_11275 [Flavobacteriales bacterium]|nr:FkbM family methyltransferase [Flavobacteriales bacterium]MBQ21326.1 hypothetical protein [Flavobacteriales bacterium]|tara:strand:- start:105745 stop:106596 length:852 start_codon:yes stop_codon:yes gene_type:complete
MKFRKIIDLIIIDILATFSTKIAKLFKFRKVLNIDFSNIQNKKGEAELLLLPYLLHKDSVFLDIGANRGIYCFFSGKIISENNIIAFEPVPKLARMLKKLFPNALIIEKALSDQKGRANLNIPIHQNNYLLDTRSTLEKESSNASNTYETISVEITTLNDFVKLNKIEKISLIKIDVEGHELKLLAGAKNILINNRPSLIIEIELNNHNNNLDTIFAFIDQLDYLIYFFEIETLSLTQVYSHERKLVVPIERLEKNHNYICFPKEKPTYANNINAQIRQSTTI